MGKNRTASTANTGAGAPPAPLPAAVDEGTSLPGTPTVQDEGGGAPQAAGGVAVAVVPARMPGYGDRPPETNLRTDPIARSRLSDRPMPRKPEDPVSQAVALAYGLDSPPLHQYNCTEQGWLTPQGEPLIVSRWYWHVNFVLDHPEHSDGRMIREKQALFARLGIAYAMIAPNEFLTTDQLRLRVAQARDQVITKGAANHA